MISDGIPEQMLRDATGLLSHFTTEELRTVLQDDARLDDLLKDVKQGNEQESEKEMLLVSNRSLAEYNLSVEPIVISYKNEIMKYSEEGEECYKKVAEKYERLLDLLRQNNLDEKLSVLQLATAEIEEKSEELAETFLSGGSDVEDFLEQFISQRKLMHLNKVKTEKMSEMIRQQEGFVTTGNYNIQNSRNTNHFNMNGMP